MAWIDPGVYPDDTGTIGGQGIVKLRVLLQLVDRFHILDKEPSPVLKRSRQWIQIHLFRRILPIICPDPDQVAFVAYNIDEFVLFKKSFNG